MDPVLILYLNEGSGTTAYDRSGLNNHGTIYNPTWIQVWIDWFLYFNGVNTYVDTPWVQNNVTKYTIIAWVKTTSSQGVIVQDRGDGPGKSITLAIAPSCGGARGLCPNSQFGVPAIGLDSDNIWIGVNATKRVDDGLWHCIAGTFNCPAGQSVSPANFRIYIDGEDVTGASATRGSWTSPLTGQYGTKIGYHKPWGYYYKGYIGQVLIFKEQLSLEYIKVFCNMFRGELRKPPSF